MGNAQAISITLAEPESTCEQAKSQTPYHRHPSNEQVPQAVTKDTSHTHRQLKTLASAYESPSENCNVVTKSLNPPHTACQNSNNIPAERRSRKPQKRKSQVDNPHLAKREEQTKNTTQNKVNVSVCPFATDNLATYRCTVTQSNNKENVATKFNKPAKKRVDPLPSESTLWHQRSSAEDHTGGISTPPVDSLDTTETSSNTTKHPAAQTTTWVNLRSSSAHSSTMSKSHFVLVTNGQKTATVLVASRHIGKPSLFTLDPSQIIESSGDTVKHPVAQTTPWAISGTDSICSNFLMQHRSSTNAAKVAKSKLFHHTQGRGIVALFVSLLISNIVLFHLCLPQYCLNFELDMEGTYFVVSIANLWAAIALSVIQLWLGVTMHCEQPVVLKILLTIAQSWCMTLLVHVHCAWPAYLWPAYTEQVMLSKNQQSKTERNMATVPKSKPTWHPQPKQHRHPLTKGQLIVRHAHKSRRRKPIKRYTKTRLTPSQVIAILNKFKRPASETTKTRTTPTAKPKVDETVKVTFKYNKRKGDTKIHVTLKPITMKPKHMSGGGSPDRQKGRKTLGTRPIYTSRGWTTGNDWLTDAQIQTTLDTLHLQHPNIPTLEWTRRYGIVMMDSGLTAMFENLGKEGRPETLTPPPSG